MTTRPDPHETFASDVEGSDRVSDLPTIPGGWTERTVRVGEHAFQLTLPAAPDEFLDDDEVLAESRRCDFMPYWVHLWPAAVSLAELVLRAGVTPGTRVLELGAGVGLVGLGAAAAGLDVTFSDCRSAPVELALHNCAKHGFPARGMVLDWREPRPERFPFILASDVLYELRNHALILQVLGAMLEPGGTCWIGDAGRGVVESFPETARAAGFDIRLRDATGQPRESLAIGEFSLIDLKRPVK